MEELDRKKELLNYPKSALNLIAEMISAVKNGDELADILKACKTIYCTDNGARQITTPAGRPAFYSVYLSEFGDDILDLIDNLGTDEFFFDPREVPQNFVPILWRDGRCAGFVLEGKGLPNPHINISGLSGMGINKAWQSAERWHKTPVVLKITASEMAQDGYTFGVTENEVWCTEEVPVKYICDKIYK